MHPGQRFAIRTYASEHWPTLDEYRASLQRAGATPEEAASELAEYRQALFSGRWADSGCRMPLDPQHSAGGAEITLALLQAFRMCVSQRLGDES